MSGQRSQTVVDPLLLRQSAGSVPRCGLNLCPRRIVSDVLGELTDRSDHCFWLVRQRERSPIFKDYIGWFYVTFAVYNSVAFLVNFSVWDIAINARSRFPVFLMVLICSLRSASYLCSAKCQVNGISTKLLPSSTKIANRSPYMFNAHTIL